MASKLCPRLQLQIIETFEAYHVRAVAEWLQPCSQSSHTKDTRVTPKLGTASDAGLAKYSAKKRVEGMLVEITAI